MKPKTRRLWFVLLSVTSMALGLGAILFAFNDNLVFFYTPSQLRQQQKMAGFDASRTLRIGGIVKLGTVRSLPAGGLSFVVTDLNKTIAVRYSGLVPSLFREGQGVVAQGKLEADGSLVAQTILAKHDENYMPREVMDALKASGRWRETGGYVAQGKP